MKKNRYVRIEDGPTSLWDNFVVFFIVILTVIYIVVTTPMVSRLLIYFGWY